MIGCPQLVEIFLYAAGEDDRGIVGEAAASGPGSKFPR
jgi:hypothetical protein